MENKDLIVKEKETIFTKIKKFFTNIFKKEQKNIVQSENIKDTKVKEEEYLKDKKETFDLYNKVKNYEVDLNTVDIEKLKKIQELMKEEIKIKEKRLYQQITELNIHNYNIQKYEEEIKKYSTEMNGNL